MEVIDYAIIGAGAAGVFSAVNAASLAPGKMVTLFEATQSPLQKVRVSGGGRCNVTHHCFEPSVLTGSYPRGYRELRGAFSRFQPRDTVAWFEQRGVKLKVEADGRMFPVTDSSRTIIECLISEADRLGVNLMKGLKIEGISADRDGLFYLTGKNGAIFVARNVLLATGSSPEGHALAKQLGHTITSLAPSLFTFKISDERITGFAGTSFPDSHLQLSVQREDGTSAKHAFRGPLLITHWGMSGPAVLKLSAFAAHDLFRTGYNGVLTVNFINTDCRTAESELQTYATQHPKQQIPRHSPFSAVSLRWWAHLCECFGISPEARFADMRSVDRKCLSSELTQARYAVTGKGVFKEEFVTAGGVELAEVDFRTMESRKVKGLFLSGEVLDVDGITGGFNFQNAWTTGILAARAAASRLNEK